MNLQFSELSSLSTPSICLQGLPFPTVQTQDTPELQLNLSVPCDLSHIGWFEGVLEFTSHHTYLKSVRVRNSPCPMELKALPPSLQDSINHAAHSIHHVATLLIFWQRKA